MRLVEDQLALFAGQVAGLVADDGQGILDGMRQVAELGILTRKLRAAANDACLVPMFRDFT